MPLEKKNKDGSITECNKPALKEYKNRYDRETYAAQSRGCRRKRKQ